MSDLLQEKLDRTNRHCKEERDVMRKILALVLVGMFVGAPGVLAQQPSLPLPPALADGHRVNHALRDAAHREVMRLTGEEALTLTSSSATLSQASSSKAKGHAVEIGAGIGLLVGAVVVTPVVCHAWGGCGGEGVSPLAAVGLFGGIGLGVGAAIGYAVSRR
jgi:hypothetical protein